MSDFIEVRVIVEGRTEQTFFRQVLAPYMAEKGVFLVAQVIGKSGKKGGNVTFERASIDIINSLKQRKTIYVSTFLDYYGIDSQWPGLKVIRKKIESGNDLNSLEIGADLGKSFKKALEKIHGKQERFIPYLMVHEFESLLFSDIDVLVGELNKDSQLLEPLRKREVSNILTEFKDKPEMINNSKTTAPKKRLQKFYLKPKGYKEVIMGTIIGKEIGITRMRERCPHFNSWLSELEALRK